MKNRFVHFILPFSFPIFVEYRMRFGIVKPKMKFSFASALSFHYICRISDAVRHSQTKNEIFVCLCTHLSLYLQKNLENLYGQLYRFGTKIQTIDVPFGRRTKSIDTNSEKCDRLEQTRSCLFVLRPSRRRENFVCPYFR